MLINCLLLEQIHTYYVKLDLRVVIQALPHVSMNMLSKGHDTDSTNVLAVPLLDIPAK